MRRSCSVDIVQHMDVTVPNTGGLVLRIDAPPEPTKDLNPKEEDFARVFVETRNRGRAYREAYKPGTKNMDVIWSEGSRIAARPHVAARIRQLEILALNSMVFDPRELIQRDVDIVQADPRELIQHKHRSCRHCHGVDHAFQWKDEAEFIAAVVDAFDKNSRRKPSEAETPTPSDAGGYGFDKAIAPDVACPDCLGVGIQETVMADTRTLSPQAARLLKGIKVTANGFEVLMHDQDAAQTRLLKMVGYLTDGVDVAAIVAAARGGPVKGRTLAEDVTPQDAARSYTALLNGS